MVFKKKSENKLLLHLIVFLISFLIVVSRRPDAILNPQFWAEDGTKWYADAYNNGIFTSLLTPADGYFQTISRLTAGLAQFVPFTNAPLLFNVVAISCKILVVNVLISSRYDELIPNKLLRFAIALLYLAIPNSSEVHANVTNAHWHLAIMACIIILAKPSKHLIWKVFDVIFLAISALSGPFSLFLLPVAAIQWWQTRNRWTLNLLGIVLAGAILQGLSLTVITGFDRPSKAPLGATIDLFFKIIGGQIFLATLIGQNGYHRIASSNYWNIYFGALITLAGCLPVAYAVWKGKTELKLYLLFAGLLTLGALLSPAVTQFSPQWQVLGLPFAGNRYWLIPAFGFILTLVFIVTQASSRYLQIIAALFLLVLPIGIYKDWQFTPYKDLKFPKEAEKFAAAPIGNEVEIPINPDWTMKLRKK